MLPAMPGCIQLFWDQRPFGPCFPRPAGSVAGWQVRLITHSQSNLHSLVKSFTLPSVTRKLAIFVLATLISLQYNIYKNRVKFATFKISYLARHSLRPQTTSASKKGKKISADEYFLSVEYARLSVIKIYAYRRLLWYMLASAWLCFYCRNHHV